MRHRPQCKECPQHSSCYCTIKAKLVAPFGEMCDAGYVMYRRMVIRNCVAKNRKNKLTVDNQS
jgi:hypothetical protein